MTTIKQPRERESTDLQEDDIKVATQQVGADIRHPASTAAGHTHHENGEPNAEEVTSTCSVQGPSSNPAFQNTVTLRGGRVFVEAYWYCMKSSVA